MVRKNARPYVTASWKLQKGIPSDWGRYKIRKSAANKAHWAYMYFFDCIKIMKFYKSAQPVPYFKISQYLPASDPLVFSDASAETSPGPTRIILKNGFGVTWGDVAVVETWESVFPVLSKLDHFDDSSSFEWSSTQAELRRFLVLSRCFIMVSFCLTRSFSVFWTS